MRLTLAAAIALVIATVPQAASARYVQRWPAESSKSRFLVRADLVRPIPEIEALHRTIDEGRDAGQLDRKTARRLRRQARRMASTARRHADDGDGMAAAALHEARVWAIVTKEQVDLLRAEMSYIGP